MTCCTQWPSIHWFGHELWWISHDMGSHIELDENKKEQRRCSLMNDSEVFSKSITGPMAISLLSGKRIPVSEALYLASSPTPIPAHFCGTWSLSLRRLFRGHCDKTLKCKLGDCHVICAPDPGKRCMVMHAMNLNQVQSTQSLEPGKPPGSVLAPMEHGGEFEFIEWGEFEGSRDCLKRSKEHFAEARVNTEMMLWINLTACRDGGLGIHSQEHMVHTQDTICPNGGERLLSMNESAATEKSQRCESHSSCQNSSPWTRHNWGA